MGSICARDYKGIGNEYVNEGKVIVEDLFNNEKSETFGFAHSQMSMNIENDLMPPLLRRDYKDPNVVGYQEKAISLQTGHTKGNGDGVNEDDTSYTLSRANDQAVASKLDPESSNSMKSKNPNSGIHAEDISCCLDTSTQDPSKRQGGMMILEKGPSNA